MRAKVIAKAQYIYCSMRLNKRIVRRSNCLGMHFNERPCPCMAVANAEEKKISTIVIKQIKHI